MSTTVRQHRLPLSVEIEETGECISLITQRGGALPLAAHVPRADFLAAVETECGVRIVAADAVVIERADLTDVTEDGTVEGVHGRVTRLQSGGTTGFMDGSPSFHWQLALNHLALAEYLAAHPLVPPVSDEDVETLAGLLESAELATVPESTFRPYARRLLATGRVSVTHE